ncbi:HD-GYP domain-containing protein [Ammoniphilus sp. CFH 90114]|uniref:HD-GYP domain-containing protein n=1 Tax=Ammoniphilus sp. CFH 90114 TaxID=2493665 RepID=UPI0013E95E82|nr:HD domain-containing phosphohydrolase [Ammoniphilus sp. CFH 90114]
MRYVDMEQAELGQLLGRDLYDNGGRILLKSGTKLYPSVISKLKQLQVSSLFILEEEAEDFDRRELVAAKTKDEAIQKLYETFNQVRLKQDMDLKSVHHAAQILLDEIMNRNDYLLYLQDIRTSDTYLPIHSVNVCILSIVLGQRSNIPPIKLKDLAVGALLHDIGKILVDDPTLSTPGKSNHHTWKGFEFLRKKFEVSLLSAHVCLQHHENIDGTGIPRGASGSEIPLFSQIVSMANHYDHLLYHGKEDHQLLPYEACEEIMGLANRKFDIQLVQHFLHSVNVYPTGTHVQLNTGERGTVISQHKGLPTRPVIRLHEVTESENENKKIVDLSKLPTIFIDHTLPK